jgi:hypothetical protein
MKQKSSGRNSDGVYSSIPLFMCFSLYLQTPRFKNYFIRLQKRELSHFYSYKHHFQNVTE